MPGSCLKIEFVKKGEPWDGEYVKFFFFLNGMWLKDYAGIMSRAQQTLLRGRCNQTNRQSFRLEMKPKGS